MFTDFKKNNIMCCNMQKQRRAEENKWEIETIQERSY